MSEEHVDCPLCECGLILESELQGKAIVTDEYIREVQDVNLQRARKAEAEVERLSNIIRDLMTFNLNDDELDEVDAEFCGSDER